MPRWELHRTRSKVALLLLINLVTLLGGKYTALLTIFTGEFFGEASAAAKAAKKKPIKQSLGRARPEGLPPQATRHGKAKGRHTNVRLRGPRDHLLRPRPNDTLSRMADTYGMRTDPLRSVDRTKASRSLYGP